MTPPSRDKYLSRQSVYRIRDDVAGCEGVGKVGGAIARESDALPS
jgi:hypothetical protein